MTKKIIFSGFGGQGLLTAGYLFAEASVMDGLNSTYFPSYGAEMRGGTANCHVIISEEKIASPIISSTDILVAFNSPSLNKFSKRLKNEGMAILNMSVIKEELKNLAKKIMGFKFDEICLLKLGSSRFSNIVLLGVLARITDIVKESSLIKAIEEQFWTKGKNIVTANIEALKIGLSLC
ncbi:MAG: 2-oxoacid:acceptor oxidoreductase family protein [Brevinematia bacterium]